MINHQAEALAAFPQLQVLIDLDAAWVWPDVARDDAGNVVEIHGHRFWMSAGQTDVIKVRSLTETTAARLTFDGGVLWEKVGGLVEVVQSLQELPTPGLPNAPQLVKRTIQGLG